LAGIKSIFGLPLSPKRMRADNGTRGKLPIAFVSAAACCSLVWIFLATGDRDALTVYCAAGQAEPISVLAERYRQQYDVDVRLQFGGTGTLISQVTVARRGDLLITADRHSMRVLEERAVVADVIEFARHYPVIAVRIGQPVTFSSLQELKRSGLRVAIGNPQAASIGKATRAALGDRWDPFRKSVTTMKPTVTEIAMDVQLGAVDAAIVWNSTIPQFEGLRAVRLPELDRHAETIAAGILSDSREPVEARRFARYLTDTEANRRLLARYKLDLIVGDGS